MKPVVDRTDTKIHEPSSKQRKLRTVFQRLSQVQTKGRESAKRATMP